MSARGRAVDLLRAAGVVADDGRLHLPTSGTTEAPRTVVRSPGSWLDSFDAFTEITGMRADDHVLIPTPPNTTLFLYGLAHAAYLGARSTTLDRWSPRAAAEAVVECTTAHLTPPMLAALLDRLPPSPRLRLAVVAGAATTDALRVRAAEAGVRVVDYYGAAELSFVTIRHQDGIMREFPQVDVALREGVVWARGPWLADGYAAGRRGPLRRDGAWATVGDEAHWGTAGLVVTGRGDATIGVGGATVLAEDVEAALTALPGVHEAVVIGLPHPDLGQVVAAVVVAEPDLDDSTLRRHLEARLPATHRPQRLYRVVAMPLQPSGKVSRGALRDAVLSGELSRGALP